MLLLFEQRRSEALRTLGIEPGADLASQILRLSDHFIHSPGRVTPWEETGCWAAYLSYFLPLNLARLRAVWKEVNRFIPEQDIAEIWDFGSGPGTLHWLLEEQNIEPRDFYCLESAAPAVRHHQELIKIAPTRWTPQWKAKSKPGRKAMAVFSYSWIEIKNSPPDLSAFDHLLIVEPATRENGRALMESRAQLMRQGFSVLAPCTHAMACPLLEHSAKDWCHFRIPFSETSDWAKLESYLPMKNRTLTFSYLLFSRTQKNTRFAGSIRVLGDTRAEKGKTRQLVCRGPEREFLSWLHKNIQAQIIPSGSLIRDIQIEKKSDELRVQNILSIED